MKKNKKKFIILLLIIILTILVMCVCTKVYGLLYSELLGKMQFVNGRWNIFVNDIDITNGTDISFDINQIEMDENEHVKPGNFAPGFTRTI